MELRTFLAVQISEAADSCLYGQRHGTDKADFHAYLVPTRQKYIGAWQDGAKATGASRGGLQETL